MVLDPPGDDLDRTVELIAGYGESVIAHTLPPCRQSTLAVHAAARIRPSSDSTMLGWRLSDRFGIPGVEIAATTPRNVAR